jgi:hypothetical protein
MAAQVKTLRAKGSDIVNQGGVPDFSTPVKIGEAGVAAILEQFTK